MVSSSSHSALKCCTEASSSSRTLDLARFGHSRLSTAT